MIRKKLIAGILSATAVVLSTSMANAEDKPTVRINQAFQSPSLSTYTANDVGFFDEEGLKKQVTTGGGGSQSWSAVLGGSADYSIQDPIFPSISKERGGPGVVVGTVCNAETIYALAKESGHQIHCRPARIPIAWLYDCNTARARLSLGS